MPDLTDRDIENIARTAHGANLEWCQSHGDWSITPWVDAPDWQKESVMDGVRFHVNNPSMSPEQSHENWCKFKEKDGWVWGERKDPVAKTHPCLLDYWDLPFHHRMKDHIFRAVVHAMVEHYRESK